EISPVIAVHGSLLPTGTIAETRINRMKRPSVPSVATPVNQGGIVNSSRGVEAGGDRGRSDDLHDDERRRPHVAWLVLIGAHVPVDPADRVLERCWHLEERQVYIRFRGPDREEPLDGGRAAVGRAAPKGLSEVAAAPECLALVGRYLKLRRAKELHL